MYLRSSLGAFSVALAIVAMAASAPSHAVAIQKAQGETDINPIRLPAPPFAAAPAAAGSQPNPKIRLAKVAERRNAITDTDRWFTTNKLQWPAVEVRRLRPGDRGGLPPAIPLEHAGAELWRVIQAPPFDILIYGGRYVAGYDTSTQRYRFAYDFGAYIKPPVFVAADRDYVDETVEWASADDRTLYVSNFHRTYARSSRGANAYITAIDLASHRMVWRSQPLVANANNFLVVGDAVIAGYGFTAEADYLYVLNRLTGSVLQRLAVRSGPEHLLRRDDRVFVRTYDTDYVMRITGQ